MDEALCLEVASPELDTNLKVSFYTAEHEQHYSAWAKKSSKAFGLVHALKNEITAVPEISDPRELLLSLKKSWSRSTFQRYSFI